MLTPDRRAELVLSIETCDPQHLIRDALAGAAAAGGWSPRELYLAWLLNLPAEIDAAHAAAFLLKRTRPPQADDRAARALVTLLRTTTAYPRERLEPGMAAGSRLH